jgi:H2-forming N5,N10-methylenetetrahydromethanopterin dehydrogenase-like enzyme
MKFLIFNIIVLCSLGYLLTSNPNENFKQWFSNTKDKVTNLTKKEIVTTFKKATSSDKSIENNQNTKIYDDEKKVNRDINIISNNKNIKNINRAKVEETSKIANSKITEEKEKKLNDIKIKKIINDILEAKNKRLFQDKEEVIINQDSTKENNNQKIQTPNEKFMSLDERENALAELIIDMELLHLRTLK